MKAASENNQSASDMAERGNTALEKFTGKGVYGAVAIGRISIFKKPEALVKRVRIDDTKAEKERVVAAKAAVESMYTAVCNVSETTKVKNENGITSEKEVITLENQPCRVAFKTKTTANDDGNGNAISQQTALYIAPELKIKEGSRITVMQNGITNEYVSSGISSVYLTHQEIPLVSAGDYA